MVCATGRGNSKDAEGSGLREAAVMDRLGRLAAAGTERGGGRGVRRQCPKLGLSGQTLLTPLPKLRQKETVVIIVLVQESAGVLHPPWKGFTQVDVTK
jgi:hypothetical protein